MADWQPPITITLSGDEAQIVKDSLGWVVRNGILPVKTVETILVKINAASTNK